MKKNETKPRKLNNMESMTKEQLEDRAFARMLLWLATAAVVEVIMVLLNRFYVHARVSELDFKFAMFKVLTAFPFIGAALFVIFVVLALRQRRGESGKDGTLLAAIACGFLCVGVGGILMRNLEASIVPMILVTVPGLGVIMMVYYLYQREFFACVLVGAMGMLGLWLFRAFGASQGFYIYLVITIVVAVVGALLGGKLKGDDGMLRTKSGEFALLQSEASYLPYFLTAIFTVVLLLLPLGLGSAMAYYAIWVLAAWLFILAVYFTSKLM